MLQSVTLNGELMQTNFPQCLCYCHLKLSEVFEQSVNLGLLQLWCSVRLLLNNVVNLTTFCQIILAPLFSHFVPIYIINIFNTEVSTFKG